MKCVMCMYKISNVFTYRMPNKFWSPNITVSQIRFFTYRDVKMILNKVQHPVCVFHIFLFTILIKFTTVMITFH